MSLKDKLKEREDMIKSENFDWRTVKRKFVNDYGSLILELRNHFNDYANDGLAEVLDIQVQVQEEHNGEYLMDSIQLMFNSETIIFYPIGAEILGASGRFDFYPLGKKDKAKRVLRGKSSDGSQGCWIFWEPNGPYHKKEFSIEKLEEIIEGWI